MVAHVFRDGVHVDVAEPEHQARRLHAPALVALLHRAARGGGHERIGGRIDRALGEIRAHPADRGERRPAHRTALVAHGVDHQRVQQQLHARFAHQVEQQRLVNLGIERRDRRHVVRRIRNVSGRAAERDQPLHDLLRDPAHDPVAAGVKGHPRPDHRRRGRTAEEAVALDQERTRAGTGRRQRRSAAGVAAAHDQNVVLFHALAFAGRARSTAEGTRGVQ